MRSLLALALLALPLLPGTAGAEASRGIEASATPSVGAARELLHEHPRGARQIFADAEATRTAPESAPRASSPTIPAPRATLRALRRSLARGSTLERGFRDALLGDHIPYYPIAPPVAR